MTVSAGFVGVPTRIGPRNLLRELEICALYSGGETQTAIGERYGVSRERIRQIVKRNGLGGLGRGIDPLRVLAALPGAGSTVELANQTGFDVQAVARLLRALVPTASAEMQAYRREERRNRALAGLGVLAERLGRTPTTAELNFYGPRVGVLQRLFGSLSRAQIMAGLRPNRTGRPCLADRPSAERGGVNAKTHRS